MKKYKQSSPETTIYKIREILQNIGILTKDIHYGHHPFYSCRVTIGNTELNQFEIGTNGKGKSFEYSMASGYAEFLERLQNNILLPHKKYATKHFLKSLSPESIYVKKLVEKDLILGYLYDEKEEVWNIESIIDHCGDDLMKILCIDTKENLYRFFANELEMKESLMAPFFSVKDNAEKLMPIDIFISTCASNGMCAGNTREEALVQGFCEIFERYVLRQIYFNEMTPPTIPICFFENTPVYEELVYLKNNSNFEVIIKDCSLGKGYPVIGVLFLDRENQCYNFKLGADFVPYIALERCLTEIHQGVTEFETLTIEMSDIENITHPYPIEKIKEHNLHKIYINHSGYWPLSLFSDKPSYEFNDFNKSYGKSDAKDLKRSIELISEKGYNIYIRDNSILGFPTYHIVIPGFSKMITSKELYFGVFKKNYKNISIKGLHKIDKGEAKKIADAIDDNYYLIKYYFRNYIADSSLYNTEMHLLQLDIEILAFMLFYFINDTTRAKKYLDLFLNDKDRDEYKYYYAITDYITLKYLKKYSIEETKSLLENFYGESISEEVFSDISDPNKIFDYYQFPNCFNCEECPVSKTCSYEYVLKIQKEIHKQAEKNCIKQMDLSQILSNT